jgi:hypothetical protein
MEVHQTPGTHLQWSNLNEWMDGLRTLFRRSTSSKTFAQIKTHWEELSHDLAKKWINAADQTTAQRFLNILQDRNSHMGGHGLHSLKGSDKKWELLNMAVKNRLAALRGEKSPPRWQEIGKNADGLTLFEDKTERRSYVYGGIRFMEPLPIDRRLNQQGK